MTTSRWALLGSLYVTQHFSVAFFIVALVAILRANKVALETISMVYLLGLVWALKFLWAPWIDRWKILQLGHFRAWLIGMQSIMIMCLITIGIFDPVHEFWKVYGLCFLLSLASATQDVATDGLAYRLVPKRDRGIVNGLQAAATLFGYLLSGGGLLMAYPSLGWSGCTLILAAGTAVPLMQVLCFREPTHPTYEGEHPRIFKRMWALVLRPGQRCWLTLILFYPLGVSLSYALITPILLDAGWGLVNIGLVVNVGGSLCGILAALLTGSLIRRFGTRPVLIGAAGLQIPGISVLALPLTGATGILPVTLVVGVFFFCYNPVVTVLTTLMMNHADPGSPATDYTLQYGLYLLFSMLSAALSTAAAGQFGYMWVLGIAAVCSLIMVPLAIVQRLGILSVSESTDDRKYASGTEFIH